jgi:hypothetical protein
MIAQKHNHRLVTFVLILMLAWNVLLTYINVKQNDVIMYNTRVEMKLISAIKTLDVRVIDLESLLGIQDQEKG